MFYPITIALFAPTLKQAQDVSIDIAKQNSDEATRIIKGARLVSFKDGTHIRYGSQFDSPEMLIFHMNFIRRFLRTPASQNNL